MLDSQILEKAAEDTTETVQWLSMLRRGAASKRADKPKHFYPIFVDPRTSTIRGVGDPIPLEQDRHTVVIPDGLTAVWPMRTNGDEGRWQLKKETFVQALSEGRAKLGAYNKNQDRWAINYLNEGTLAEIKSGAISIVGTDENGAMILKRTQKKLVEPKSVWNQTSHNASEYGTSLLNGIIGSGRFSFPKSVYAVQDTIRFITAKRPNALIVDFFAGSGTTLHAVNLLNAEDNGHRRCILITNNEVSNDEAVELEAKGYHPGDSEWNKLGIARYVTWPRTVCSIMGKDINGQDLKGSYLGSDAPMSNGFKTNAVFFQLGFLDKTAVALGMRFNEILPMLWMKAGAIGVCPETVGHDIPTMLILPKNKFAVLNNETAFARFEEELARYPEIQTVFLTTDYDVNYRAMVKNLNVANAYQLYRDYLDHFRLNRGRS